ncbi:ESX secretion-associated protein EspG [Actinophytocola oryzae]|uniref:ESAT-6 protein secretion system EspG family protein n=1 Tax=Actinophytocola oryzae TaxID=502181 RepID=A0A4R7VM48_9PSEU|nr:ESX secretion-associated protein EspG [Actinophytocola oryzae]TDV50670.1 ESAT-6 protein secretion system EspG family protein [Actinophytocola oryzae]
MIKGTVVLSKLEFDVLWESEKLPAKHEALTVPSPGRTHTERRRLVARAFADLERRGLAERERAVPDLVDQLNLLAHHQLAIDSWVWTDHRISSLAVVAGSTALLCAVDGPEVWLIPARETSIAAAAVSIAGEVIAGPGRSVSVPTDVLGAADAEARGDARAFAASLTNKGIAGTDAKTMADMVRDMNVRGQFCVTRLQRDQRMVRADRVVAFHDTPRGRYVHLAKPNNDGRMWSTVTPADSRRLASCVQELMAEV